MSAGTLIALIIAITGLLGVIPAIILAFKGKATASKAAQMAETTFKALSAHAQDSHGAEINKL